MFGDRSIVAMLALLSAFPPLSTDLYLPALPHVAETLQTNQPLVNLTLSLFFVFFALVPLPVQGRGCAKVFRLHAMA